MTLITSDSDCANLLWLDMEMTGLDPKTCVIIEIAAIASDPQLRVLGTFDEVVWQPQTALDVMDEWNTTTHGQSGLLTKVPGGRALCDVESDLLAFCDAHFGEEPIVLCGNSIGQDRKFVDRYMPRFAARLHYRMIDVSSFKEMLRRRFGLTFEKGESHRALSDIQESMGEMAFYLGFFRPT